MCGDFPAGAGGADVAAADLGVELGVAAARPRVSLIVEEKPICRVAMADLLKSIVPETSPVFAASLPQGLDAAHARRPQVALVDLFSIGFDFEGLRRLVAASGAAVVAVDDRPNPTFARLARLAGACGYASKNYEMEPFRSVVRSVVEGGAHFPRELEEALPRGPARAASGLSPRQLEVLKCIAVGMSNQEIGRSLGITPGTVKLHIHAILRATGTRNRTEVALIAGRFLAPMAEA